MNYMSMPEVMAQLHEPSKFPTVGWDNFPEGSSGLKGGLMLYLEKGVQAGSGLMSVLEGDLWKAGNALDDNNWRYLRELMRWIYNNPPHVAYGSRETVTKWISHRGAEGYDNA